MWELFIQYDDDWPLAHKWSTVDYKSIELTYSKHVQS